MTLARKRNGRGVLDHPPEPVIRARIRATQWRMMTAVEGRVRRITNEKAKI